MLADVLGNLTYTSSLSATSEFNLRVSARGALSSLSHVSTSAGGLLETRTYTPRLQPDLLQAGVNGGAFFLNLDYNFTEPATGKNNGNVYQVANLRNTNRTTDYTYDSLNRIKTATTLGPDWGQSFAIDAWGNLTAQSVTKGAAPAFSATALASNRLSSYSYDAAGNMLGDGQHTYVYNAESQVASLDSGATAYVYDASGQRLRKTTGTNWTEYLYWGADPVAERDQTGVWTEYVFFGGKRVARRESAGAVYCYFSDHLGSADVVTDAAGVIKEESDYYPYGGERVLTDLLPKQNYKFTGKERDTESGLDYFGARYYASRMGRWLTPDWANGAEAVPYADFGDPQSLNLYGYVGNQPVTRFDADGHCPGCFGETGYIYQSTGSISGELDRMQTTLALASFIPGPYGRGAALLNAGISVLRGNKKDAAINASMALIPGGGTAKGLKAMTKAEQLAASAAKGKAAEKAAVESLKAEGREILGEQVGVQTSQGLRRVDTVTKDATGQLANVEVKSGEATRNASQVAKDTEIATEGGTYVGKNAPESLRGQKVKVPTEVRKENPN
ncbi:MAG: RHS repeat-associated core domain-containing protein [Acidobacteriales bacterium]|nr:RHS repeat-associated core domain-containing protein [Terriglobales bacterium]